MSLDHASLGVPPAKFDEVLKFYLAALAPIGYTRQFEYPGVAGLGTSQASSDLWLAAKDNLIDAAGFGVHIAFKSPDRVTVEKFHAEALKAGGTCNGKPGLRPLYGPGYYGAFILDPVGNNLELVFHEPQ